MTIVLNQLTLGGLLAANIQHISATVLINCNISLNLKFPKGHLKFI